MNLNPKKMVGGIFLKLESGVSLLSRYFRTMQRTGLRYAFEKSDQMYVKIEDQEKIFKS